MAVRRLSPYIDGGAIDDLSVRTLQRRLADLGIVYSDLVVNARRDLALALLADQSNSQLEIALSVGYAEAASFTRSFKQWTGMMPSEYRRTLEEVG